MTCGKMRLRLALSGTSQSAIGSHPRALEPADAKPASLTPGIPLAAVGFCALLSACASAPAEPLIKTVEVRTPVPVYCKADVPERGYPDTDAALRAAPAAEDRYLLLAAGRKMRVAVEKELRVALKACHGPDG